jgi:putative proteasome-type protease
MTYCLGILNRYGLVMAADSRTNAGVDYISAYKKLFNFSVAEDRSISICTSGNLSITQDVLATVKRDIQKQEERNLHTISSMYEVAHYLGGKIRQVQERERPWLEKDKIDFHCNILCGGQIRGEETQLYQIYSQGNFIQATQETPYLQIGETKYGKPILDRTIKFDTPIEDVAKCALLSIDSTMKSNISVGPPINLIMYRADSFSLDRKLHLKSGDPYLMKIQQLWGESLRQAFESIPNIEWQDREQESQNS